MIRQAVTCDICGTDKKATNHWFVALDLGAELRLSGWDSPNCQIAGSKHLCGNACLHKMVDVFMARLLAERPQPAAAEEGRMLVSSAMLEERFRAGAMQIPLGTTPRQLSAPVVP